VPQPFLGPPFRVFPSQGLPAPLGAACFPAVIHPPAVTHCPRLIAPGFADAHAFARLPGSPSDYELPFHMPEDTFPGRPGLEQQAALYSELRLLRSFVPLTNPFALDSGCPSPTVATLLVFSPSKVFSDHASKPVPAQASRT